MSIFSKLFDKTDPHSEYMQLELELEDLASSAGCSLAELKQDTDNFTCLSVLASIVGEEQATEAQKKNQRMRELFPLLTLEQRSYHTQDHADLFDEWRNKIS